MSRHISQSTLLLSVLLLGAAAIAATPRPPAPAVTKYTVWMYVCNGQTGGWDRPRTFTGNLAKKQADAYAKSLMEQHKYTVDVVVASGTARPGYKGKCYAPPPKPTPPPSQTYTVWYYSCPVKAWNYFFTYNGPTALNDAIKARDSLQRQNKTADYVKGVQRPAWNPNNCAPIVTPKPPPPKPAPKPTGFIVWLRQGGKVIEYRKVKTYLEAEVLVRQLQTRYGKSNAWYTPAAGV